MCSSDLWIKDWLKNDWKKKNKKEVINKDLWMKLYDLCKDHDITWNWVQGHDNNYYNEICDELATKEIEKIKSI